MTVEKKWFLKDKKGRIFGPFTTSKIISLIRKGALDGEESLSPEGTERWTEVSKYPEFYDIVLESLEIEKREITQADIQEAKLEDTIPNFDIQKDASRKRGRVILENEQKSSEEVISLEEEDSSQEAQKNEPEIIELISKKKLSKKNDFRFLYIGVLIAALTILIIVMLDTSKNELNSQKIILKGPKTQKPALDPKEIQIKYQSALREFQKDTFQGYWNTQNILVVLLESHPNASEALSLLCLSYRELWPFTEKSPEDLQTLTSVVQLAQKKGPYDVHGVTCRLAQAFLVGSEELLKTSLQKALDDFPTAAVFYEMRAEVLIKDQQRNAAITFLQKTQSLWPQWIKPFFVEAQLRSELKDFSNAIRTFKNILQSEPSHNKSMIELGIIEVAQFANERGLDYLQVGLEGENVPSPLLVKGYFALANYYLNTNPKLALEYAQKAYALDPRNTSLRNTILYLGGEKALQNIKSQDSQLMVVGESYLRNKNYLAAQAEFKTAFEINPKNSLAALKASEALWNLNQTQDAIEWALKSVNSNPKFIEGYIKLAEYYSSKFDFKSATNYLLRGQQETRDNYLIYRGYAQLEFKKRNYSEAIKRGEQALKLYDSDIDSLLILSKSSIQEKLHDKALQYAAKAMELDPNNPLVQEAYAEALLNLRGIKVAVEFLQNKMNQSVAPQETKVALGAVYLADQRYPSAVQVLEEVTVSDPSHLRAHMLLGKAYQGLLKYNDAVKAILKAASLDPSNAEPLFELGLIYLKDPQNINRAYRNFKKVVEINPRFPKAHLMAGQAALLMNSRKEALAYAEEEKKQNPALADPYVLIADISFSEGNYAKSASELRRAVQLRPNDSQLYVQLARSHRLLGQLDAANSMLRVAANIESGNAEIYKEQGLIFEKQNDIQAAIVSFQKYLEIRPNASDKKDIETKIMQLVGGGQ